MYAADGIQMERATLITDNIQHSQSTSFFVDMSSFRRCLIIFQKLKLFAHALSEHNKKKSTQKHTSMRKGKFVGLYTRFPAVVHIL